MDTIAARLQWALDQKGLSVRGFHRAMERRLGPEQGASYANVRRYLAGKPEPSPAFLAAAAEELEVRVEWLAFNSGEARDAAPIGARATFDRHLSELFPAYSLTSPAVQGELARVWWDLVRHRAAGSQVGPPEAAVGEIGRDVAERLARALDAPLVAFGVRPEDFGQAALRDSYLIALTHALSVAELTFRHVIGRRMLETQLETKHTGGV